METDDIGAAKIFLWKACDNALPTKVRLFQKKIAEDSVCPICKQEADNTTHILWSCEPAAKDVWVEKESFTEMEL